MAKDEMIVPVNHDFMSSVGTTTLSAGRSGLSGLFKGAVSGLVIGLGLTATAVIGFGILAFTAPGLLAIGAGIASIVSLIGGVAATGVAMGGFGAIGSAFGLIGGGLKGIQRVGHEKGASEMLQAQVAAYQASAVSPSAQTTIYAPASGDKYHFPAQGSAMNPAASSIQADSVQDMGLVNGQQRQRA